MFRKKRSTPESSIRLRLLALGAELIGILALASVTGLWWLALPAAAVVVMGHRVSYQQREKRSRAVSFALFVFIHLAFCWMLTGLMAGLPYPQVQFTYLIMAIVSFALYTRLNLYSAMGLGLVNLYVAATLSRDATFGVLLLAFIACLLAFLWRADAEDGVKGNPVVLRVPDVPTRRTRTMPPVLRFVLLLGVAAPLVFVFTPRFAAMPLVPPFTLRLPIVRPMNSQIINPALPLVRVVGQPYGRSDYYAGFADSLDLTYRGGLDDTMMMYVRSPVWSYWRSHAYDYYDGTHWSRTDDTLRYIGSGRDAVAFSLLPKYPGLYNFPPGAEVFFQTFYVMRDLPNTIFAGGQALKIVLPAERIALDAYDSVRLGEPLAAGMVYSVISAREEHDPAKLRAAGTRYPARIAALYLQLSDTLTQRTRDLAVQIAGDAATPYDAVIALRDHLRGTYPYDYFPPPQAQDTDAVDQFLFVDKRGVCEHYVTALVIMLRSLGIPARLAAGFGAGDYNPFTGYYEVRADDAHAWAEVYFPPYGWVSFDPTPGWEGYPQTGKVQTWVFSGLFEGVNLPALPLGEMASAGAALFGTLGTPLTLLAGGLLLAAAAWGLWRVWKRWGHKRWQRYQRQTRDPVRRGVLALYRRAQRQTRARRGQAQTVQEHATAHPDLSLLADAVDAAAYSKRPLGREWLAGLRAQWRKRPKRIQ